MNRLRIPAVLALLWTSGIAFADGECDKRPLTGAEKKFVSDGAAAVRKALPPAPAAWVPYSPGDAGFDSTPDETPGDTCREGGPYPLHVMASAYFTPRDSALARKAETGRKLEALRREGRKQARISAVDRDAGAAAAGDNAADMMQLQQRLMAAQASGDMAAMQKIMEQLQKSGESMTQATQQMNEQGNSDFTRSSRQYEEEQALTRKLESLMGPAALAPRVTVTVEINPRNLRARPKTARSIEVPGAAQAWVGSDAVFCPAYGDDSKLTAVEAVALVGAVVAGWDNGEAQSYEPKLPATAAGAQQSAMVRVCGDAGVVESVLRSVRLDAIRR